MKMRQFGKLGITGSAFGLGCMRFPVKEVNGEKQIDEEAAIAIIRAAIDGGVTYMDTAYVYNNQQSERVLGKALTDGYREKVTVATKLPPFQCSTAEDMERIFEESRKNIGVDVIDFYLVHALNAESWEKMKALGVREFLDKKKAEGKIRYKCFSFHDSYEAFEKILSEYDWDMCQIQFNFMDVNNQAGLKGLQLAGEKGIPVVIMEGLLGGQLAVAPDSVKELYESFPVKRTPVEWAFRWLCNFPQIATVLSGVSTMEQTLDNLRIFDGLEVGCMTEDELALIDRVREAYAARRKVGCTGCSYCMPCPGGVDIPGVFRVWNEAARYKDDVSGNRRYKRLSDEGKGASSCLECGACEDICPQKMPIRELLKQADSEMK